MTSLLPYTLWVKHAHPLAPDGVVRFAAAEAPARVIYAQNQGEVEGFIIQGTPTPRSIEGLPTAPGNYIVEASVLEVIRLKGISYLTGMFFYAPGPLSYSRSGTYTEYLVPK